MAGTDLYIKWSTASPNDTGARPITPCGPPNAVWLNQSIWLSDPTTSATLNEATVGHEVQINVTVTNKGGSTFQSPDGFGNLLTVQVWVCDFTVAVGPNGALASGGGSGGMTSQRSVNLAGGGQASFSVRWTPAAGDMINPVDGKGHVCIAANVFWEGTTPPAESQVLPPPGVLSVCGDGSESVGGHHGQRNILIAPVTMKMKMMSFGMDVFNLDRQRETFVIEVEEVLGAGAIGAAGREALLAEKWVKLVGGKPGPVRVKRDRHGPLEPVERARLRRGGRLVLKSGGRPIRIARTPIEAPTLTGKGFEGKGAKVEVTLPPKRSRRLALQFPTPNESPGTVHVFDVTQRNQHGRVLGGARIMTVMQA